MKTVCDMIEGRHGLLSLLDEVSSYKDNDGAVLVNRYNRAMSDHDHYFPGEEAVYGTAYGRERTTKMPVLSACALLYCSLYLASACFCLTPMRGSFMGNCCCRHALY